MIVAETCVWRVWIRRMAYLLQWGRDLIVAETQSCASYRAASERLQWGRDLIVAETDVINPNTATTAGFNGAAT